MEFEEEKEQAMKFKDYYKVLGVDENADVKEIKKGVTEQDFVKMRDARDATLSVPKLLLPSIQLNIQAGKLPKAEANGTRYLKLPLTVELG